MVFIRIEPILQFRPINAQNIMSKFYFVKYSKMFRCLYMIYRESFLTYAEVTKFCTFIIHKKSLLEDDVNISKLDGVLYEIDISVKIFMHSLVKIINFTRYMLHTSR